MMTDLTATRKKLTTLLVVIDPKEMTYKRYIGRTPGVRVRAQEPLLSYEIEMLRTQPELALAIPGPPESA